MSRFNLEVYTAYMYTCTQTYSYVYMCECRELCWSLCVASCELHGWFPGFSSADCCYSVVVLSLPCLAASFVINDKWGDDPKHSFRNSPYPPLWLYFLVPLAWCTLVMLLHGNLQRCKMLITKCLSDVVDSAAALCRSPWHNGLLEFIVYFDKLQHVAQIWIIRARWRTHIYI